MAQAAFKEENGMQNGENFAFQAEVGRLLDIVARSLYSDKSVFLRELISNAADACDKLRWLSLTQPELLEGDTEFRIVLSSDSNARTVTITDNGIGMNREDLVNHLGTIARSGTAAFLEQATQADSPEKLALIGQFGMGFYSAFMIADTVTVTSRKAGETQAWQWQSDGRSGFTITETDYAPHGTQITLHLKAGEDQFIYQDELQALVRRHSDHLPLPILFRDAEGREDALNSGKALWLKAKSEISDADYQGFYHHLTHGLDTPRLTLHWKAEGVHDYACLLFVPEMKPFDLFDPKRGHRVRLHVKRVFVAEGTEGLIPAWLRFVRGIVDCEDLPLNVSREMLQTSPMLGKIRNAIARKIVGEMAKLAENEPVKYAALWQQFGAVIKEGLYEESGELRDAVMKLCRFKSTAGDDLVSIAEYLGRMKDGQKDIYTLTGEDSPALLSHPHLEAFRAKGIEVLLLTDAIDEFWLANLPDIQGHKIISVTRGSADLSAIASDTPEPEQPEDNHDKAESVAKRMKTALGGLVKEVRVSNRLTSSAVCLVADEGELDMRLERLMRQHKQLEGTMPRILEINPTHPAIHALENREGESFNDAAHLLLDQARLIEGETLPDPIAFARRLSALLAN